MNLNNHIYFRDHQLFQNSGFQVSDRVHPTVATPIHFSVTGSESQGQLETIIDILQLCVICQPVKLDHVKANDTSVNGSLVSPTTSLSYFC